MLKSWPKSREILRKAVENEELSWRSFEVKVVIFIILKVFQILFGQRKRPFTVIFMAKKILCIFRTVFFLFILNCDKIIIILKIMIILL